MRTKKEKDSVDESFCLGGETKTGRGGTQRVTSVVESFSRTERVSKEGAAELLQVMLDSLLL